MAMFIQKPWYRKNGGAKIYGAEWDGSSNPVWTRTDDAIGFTNPVPAISGGTGSSPFDSIMPWAGMQIVNDTNAGKLVSIPKFYYKWTRNGTAMKLQISESQFDGSFVSPAHADRGDGVGERDIVYIGRYHCSNSDYKSTSNVKPKTYITRQTGRTKIHELGSSIWQMDFAMWWTVNLLYLVEFANWNSQETIGFGTATSYDNTEYTGASDNMRYHTGTMQSSRSTKGVGCQYRYIEDWWGNVCDYADGIYINSTNIYCIKNPADFSDSSGGIYVGSRANASGYIKAWNIPTESGFEYALCPSEVGANLNNYYITDYHDYGSNSNGVLYVGSHYAKQSSISGAFYFGGQSRSTNYSNQVGCRLMKLP